jgi:hypothetical protein
MLEGPIGKVLEHPSPSGAKPRPRASVGRGSHSILSRDEHPTLQPDLHGVDYRVPKESPNDPISLTCRGVQGQLRQDQVLFTIFRYYSTNIRLPCPDA